MSVEDCPCPWEKFDVVVIDLLSAQILLLMILITGLNKISMSLNERIRCNSYS
jgi:hypothetical protein